VSGGTWTQADAQNTATRPGIYINFIGQAQAAVQVGAQGIVAVPGTADWGLVNGVTAVTSEAQIPALLGSGQSLPLLVAPALRGGASTVLAYRMAVSGAAAKASLTLNAGDASGAALLVTSKYEGVRANGFTVKVSTNAADASQKDLTVLEAGTVLEVFTGADNATIANRINGTDITVNASRYLTATVQGATGRSLGNNGSGAPMTGGNSGESVTATEYTQAMTALETQQFNLFVTGDTTNTAIQASVRAWVERLRAEGTRIMATMGGQNVAGFSSAAVATEFANARSAATGSTIGNSTGVVYVFPGIVDELSGASLSGAQSAARAAGMIARAGFAESVTKADSSAADVTARLVNSDIKLGLQSGLFLWTVDGGRVVAEQGINSLTTFTQTQGRNFRKIRTIRTIDAVASTIATAASQNLIGKVNNDAQGRAYAIGLITTSLDIFQQAGAIEPGYTARANSIQGDPDEFYVTIEIAPIDSLEKVFISAKVL
jgi:hypothetical protein